MEVAFPTQQGKSWDWGLNREFPKFLPGGQGGNKPEAARIPWNVSAGMSRAVPGGWAGIPGIPKGLCHPCAHQNSVKGRQEARNVPG